MHPPHDITGKKIARYLPQGKGGDTLRELMEKAREILMSTAVNRSRLKKGLNPANSLWFWGQGKKSGMPGFFDRYGLKGALISAVDLTKGLGICAGFDILDVKGATGYIDTNYIGKAHAALRALNKYDIVYVHVEAPDEAGHNGDIRAKIKAIEDFDEKVVGTIMKGLRKFKEYRVLVLPDHFTPISVRTHTCEPVPFVIFSSPKASGKSKAESRKYSEGICRMKNILVFEKGYRLMDYFIKGGLKGSRGNSFDV